MSSPAPRAILPLENQWLWAFWFARDDELHHLYYLQADRSLGDPEQRHWNVSIGHAASSDLHHWTRHSANPLLSVDGRYYETLEAGLWHDQAWRDPCVIADPCGSYYHMFFTARANHGPADARGVIGHATSEDLYRWQTHPPVRSGSLYGELEVPQSCSHWWRQVRSATTKPPKGCNDRATVVNSKRHPHC